MYQLIFGPTVCMHKNEKYSFLKVIFLMYFSYRVLVQDGRFVTHVPVSNHWVHSVINYIGPNAGEGFRLYLDGINVKNETRKRSSTSISNNGTIVTGRLFTDFDEFYASFQMDELLFYNRTLTEPEIIMLSQNTAWKCLKGNVLHSWGKDSYFLW